MLASVESAVPIIGTQIYTSLYSATKLLDYPGPGSCYFATCGFILLGMMLTMGNAFRYFYCTLVDLVSLRRKTAQKSQI